MRLHVNLIPALAYALVMMLSNMTGISGTAGEPAPLKQVTALHATCPGFNSTLNSALVTRDGQIILSNGTAKGGLKWKIPFRAENSFLLF
jgi:hypothetical protein